MYVFTASNRHTYISVIQTKPLPINFGVHPSFILPFIIFVSLYTTIAATVTIHHTNMTVGIDVSNLICWQPEEFSALESLTTDCGDPSCSCCIENCCDGEDCYPDVDWHYSASFSVHNPSGNND